MLFGYIMCAPQGSQSQPGFHEKGMIVFNCIKVVRRTSQNHPIRDVDDPPNPLLTSPRSIRWNGSAKFVCSYRQRGYSSQNHAIRTAWRYYSTTL